MSSTSAPPTREEQIAKLRADGEARAAAAAAPPPPDVEKPVAAASEPVAPASGVTAAKPAAGEIPAAGSEGAAAAPEMFSIDRAKLKRKIKNLDVEEIIDLGEKLDKSPEWIDEQIRKSRDRDRQEQKRLDAEERAEKAGPEAVRARDAEWHQALAKSKLRFDPATGQVVPLQQPAPAAAPGQPDLDALEKKFLETNEPEDYAAYTRALRQLSSRPLDGATIQREIDQRLGNREAYQRKVSEFNVKLDAAYTARASDFDAAGPEVGAQWRRIAAERATAHSLQDGATPESTLKVIHETADLVKNSVAAAQRKLAVDPTKPRAKAPTVLPSGGAAPAGAETDPAKIDGSTPEGKAKRIEILRRQGEARRLRAS